MQRSFPPRLCPRGGGGAPEGNGPESYRDYVTPRNVTGEVFRLSDVAVLTPAVAEDFSLADDAGGSPSVIRVSEPLQAVVGAVPLIDVGKASSVVGRRPAEPSDSDALRDSEDGRSPVEIIAIPKLIEHLAVGGIADRLLASRWKHWGIRGSAEWSAEPNRYPT